MSNMIFSYPMCLHHIFREGPYFACLTQKCELPIVLLFMSCVVSQDIWNVIYQQGWWFINLDFISDHCKDVPQARWILIALEKDQCSSFCSPPSVCISPLELGIQQSLFVVITWQSSIFHLVTCFTGALWRLFSNLFR